MLHNRGRQAWPASSLSERVAVDCNCRSRDGLAVALDLSLATGSYPHTRFARRFFLSCVHGVLKKTAGEKPHIKCREESGLLKVLTNRAFGGRKIEVFRPLRNTAERLWSVERAVDKAGPELGETEQFSVA
jgi:hypothetical protein